MLLAFLQTTHIRDEHESELNSVGKLAIFHFVNGLLTPIFFFGLDKLCFTTSTLLLGHALSHSPHQVLEHFAGSIQLDSLHDKRAVLRKVCQELERCLLLTRRHIFYIEDEAKASLYDVSFSKRSTRFVASRL